MCPRTKLPGIGLICAGIGLLLSVFISGWVLRLFLGILLAAGGALILRTP